MASMKQVRHSILVLIGVCVFSASASAKPFGYDPKADPSKTYAAALEKAKQQGKYVLLVFGSDWCPDCRSLNKKMQQKPLKKTVGNHFIVAHVDIGNWDKNMGFTEQFGEPVANGIPSIAIVGADKSVHYVSQAGEFASARHSKTQGLNDWFEAKIKAIKKAESPAKKVAPQSDSM